MPIRPGLCSVTLRALSWEQVLETAKSAGLASIEWGGDIHVPLGDVDVAHDVAERSTEKGIAVASYGSYFVAGVSPHSDIEPLLATACALGAPRIRAWAGRLGSAETDAVTHERVVRGLRELADAAQLHGITIGLEYHGGTLTDSAESTLQLLDTTDRENLSTYWQPPVGMPNAAAVLDLRKLLARVCAVHTFSWWPGTNRLALGRRASLWNDVMSLLDDDAREINMLLEFVAADNVDQLRADARDLIEWSHRGHRPSPLRG